MCPSFLERFEGASWVKVTSEQTCGNIGLVVEGRSSRTMLAVLNTPDHNLPVSLAGGIYRIVIRLEQVATYAPAPSAPFRVAPPG